ncbi:MAG TPA: S26 family signal peptidase, partial [Candidatus Hydrogenedentes bacterium]|nr:S26 family signal peptidase [Candidatus Hydrogenedentota bacterium]
MEFEEDPLETPAETAETSEPQQEARRELYEFVKMVLVFLVVFWCLKTFVIEGYEVQGESMDPTLVN